MTDIFRAPPIGRVGYAPIDEQHFEFARLAARLATGIDVAEVLQELVEHIDRHFGLEERLMADTDFAPRACHAREHASVRAVVVEVQRRHCAGETEYAQRLAEALPPWFALHAGTMDAALASFLRDRTDAPRSHLASQEQPATAAPAG